MITRLIFAIVLVVLIVSNVFAVVARMPLLEHLSEICFLIVLLSFFIRKNQLWKSNFTGFALCAIAANLSSLVGEYWYFSEITLGFWLAVFVFLIMEAVKYTQYSRRNRYLHLYFLVVVLIYSYLLTLHIIEIEQNLTNDFMFSMYLIYYINLFILGTTALIYYLNSFSRKAVFFSCLALAFILSDVLRDMGNFYFRDLSVEIVGALIKHAALGLTLLFFITRERKLRLFNLV